MAAEIGSSLSRINLCALKKIKKDKLPDIRGETTQLAAMFPTLPQDTASKPIEIITNPTIAPTIE